jgi:hypothetical protein
MTLLKKQELYHADTEYTYLLNKWGKMGVLRVAKLPAKPPLPGLLR